MTRRKLRWILSSPRGEQIRSGLSFGAFDPEQAVSRALSAAAPTNGDRLDVYVDGAQICSLRVGVDMHAT